MTAPRLWVMLAAFAAQNIEEALFLPVWAALTVPGIAPGHRQFALAVAILTILSGLVLLWAHRRGLAWPIALIAGALLANAATHLVISLGTGSVMPGALSGLILQGPAALWVLLGLPLSRRARSLWVLGGLVLTPPVAALALALSGLLVN